MKHNQDPFSGWESFKKILSAKTGTVNNVSTEALILIAEQQSASFVVLCNISDLEDIASQINQTVGLKHVCLSNKNTLAPFGFSDFYSNIFKQSRMLFNGNPKKFKGVFVDLDFYKTAFFSTTRKRNKKINEKISHKGLIRLLQDYKYIQHEETLSFGGFVVRGGIIDVAPIRAGFFYRISFLEQTTKIYIINKAGQISEKKKSFILISNNIEKKHSVFSYFSKSLVYNYVDSALFWGEKGCHKAVSLQYKNIGRASFDRRSPKKNICVVDWLGPFGLLLFNTWFIPRWFINKQVSPQNSLQESFFFSVGSFYVHEDFGICCFVGFGLIGKKECVCLKFSDGLVRLDVSMLSKICFYSGANNKTGLDSINRPLRWKKKQRSASVAARNYVKKLFDSYKKREKISRPAYRVNGAEIDSFVSSFSYIDTVDQKNCWNDICKDLGSLRPMNRLVCGDVGFGKTELAIRTSFVVVLGGGPVVVVAPTTILAQQLFSCFNERLNKYGAIVGLVIQSNNSRVFNSFLNNKIDVLVGTHSILKNPKILKKTALFIVDEEHRFGVRDKEVVFNNSPCVDFLALSATPIPRSLQFSLSNIRSFSLLMSPPSSRLPIICNINFFDFSVIQTIIYKELSRNGQVFFVDNSVQNLRYLFNKTKKVFPSFSFDLIYGGLDAPSLKSKMGAFVSKSTSVLFATTIIESGIDVGSANTIIINNSHLFGLSQLHQLRGRVGRSNVQAFAYFFIPKKSYFPPLSLRRLRSIVKHTSLGSGYLLSLSDLEIRGAGSLFGYNQSGLVGVGFNYYTKLISKTYRLLGGAPSCCDASSVSFSLGLIPDSYISKPQQRAFFYNKISEARSLDDLKKIKKDLVLSFGFCHNRVALLLKDRDLSFLARKKHVQSITKANGRVLFVFCSKYYSKKRLSLTLFVAGFFNEKKINYFLKNRRGLLNLEYENRSNLGFVFLRSFLVQLNL